MIELHPEILKKNGRNEFVVLPYEEFLQLQEILANAEDLRDLKEAIQAEGDAPTISLGELKATLLPQAE